MSSKKDCNICQTDPMLCSAIHDEILPKQDLNRLRNAIHNEAGVTKQEIREMVEQAVKHIVEKRVKQLLPDEASVTRLVDNAIEERAWFWGGEKELHESIQNKIVTKLASKIKIEVKTK